ncbi:unnamed protein product [Linum tenue]|uniref:Replication protein A OB domain-containing protein n=1 Tax=Linum tenue TaxID=586396 RepID=A0AAV0R0G7_9ROSI|nr:unnamed protein product [Linum tenue]
MLSLERRDARKEIGVGGGGREIGSRSSGGDGDFCRQGDRKEIKESMLFVSENMEFTLLCNLGGPRNAAVSLRLRLLHVWPSKSPGDIRIYNYCTLWTAPLRRYFFCFRTLIHGVSPTSMAAGIRRNLYVGKIYVVKSFGLSNPPNQYRPCSFDLALGLSPSTSFQACGLPAESFPVDAYEFVSFSQLSMRAGNHRFLTDVVDRLHSISGISHKITNNGPIVKQTVIIEDESGAKVTITLWDEFSAVLDNVALTQADSIEAMILAFGGLLVNKLGDDYILSSSAGKRIAVNPPVPKAYYLASRFAEKHEVVESLPVEFTSVSDAIADADWRTKSLDQLLSLSRTNSSLEEKYRCGGVIVDVESSTPWYYISCKLYSRAVSKRRDNRVWCPKDWQLEEEQTRVNYKLQLTLRDDSCEARFILMGGCAHALINVSAAHLAQRFPHRLGQLPPQLYQLRGQYVKFDCKLPLPGPTGFSSGEFRVTQVVPLDDPTVVGDLLEYSSQSPLAGSAAVPTLTMGAASVAGGSSASSRVAKGKENVSGPLLTEVSATPFSITEGPDEAVSPIAEDLHIPPLANVESEGTVAGPQILGGSHSSGISVQAGSSPAAAAVPVPSSAQSCTPSGRSTPSMITKRTTRIDESASPEDVSRGSLASAAKILKPSPESSPGKTSGLAAGSSPATLLVSPLAKIKVEKLDDAEAPPLPHGGSSQAGAEMEGDSPADSQKNPTTKRVMFKSNASQEKKDSISNSDKIFKAKEIALPDFETVGLQEYNDPYFFSGTRGTQCGS